MKMIKISQARVFMIFPQRNCQCCRLYQTCEMKRFRPLCSPSAYRPPRNHELEIKHLISVMIINQDVCSDVMKTCTIKVASDWENNFNNTVMLIIHSCPQVINYVNVIKKSKRIHIHSISIIYFVWCLDCKIRISADQNSIPPDCWQFRQTGLTHKFTDNVNWNQFITKCVNGVSMNFIPE
jgi:hypothetical protein